MMYVWGLYPQYDVGSEVFYLFRDEFSTLSKEFMVVTTVEIAAFNETFRGLMVKESMCCTIACVNVRGYVSKACLEVYLIRVPWIAGQPNCDFRHHARVVVHASIGSHPRLICLNGQQ